MTYLQFHLLFVLPPLLALVAVHRLARAPKPRRLGVALAAMAGIALIYTTPWDNFLVARGVWSYPPGRVSFTIGYVPFEEYLFFVLQTLLTGSWLALLWPRLPVRKQPRGAGAGIRVAGAALFVLAAAAGGVFLVRSNGLYLGLVLVWAAPVLALQWGFGGDLLLARWRLLAATVVPSTLYLSLADRFALARGIWSIAPDASTGVLLGGLPLEEGVFFFATNLMIVLGLALVLDARSPSRIAALRARVWPGSWRVGGWRAALVAWAVLMVPVPLLGETAFVPLAYLSTALLTLGTLGLAVERAGRRALPAALVALAFGWGIELLGSRTGVPFGRYHYLTAGPELLGVPLLVPLGWFAFAVLALQVAPGRLRWPGAAAALVAWDLGLDPLMVRQGLWRFEPAGAYAGVPVMNFLGWAAAGVALAALLVWLAPGLGRGRAPEARIVYLAQAGFIGVGLALFGLPRAGLVAAAAMVAVVATALGPRSVRNGVIAFLTRVIAWWVPIIVVGSLRRGLAGVWVRDEGALPEGGAVVAANHHSWWDGYLLFLAARRRRRPFTVLMDERQLARFPFFRPHGAIGAGEVRTALVRLAGGHLVAVFPEAGLKSAGSPTALAPGAAFLARRGRRPLVPVALRVTMRGSQRPEAFVRFGPPLEPDRPDLAAALAGALADLVQRLDAELAACDPERPPPGYRRWLAGRASTDRRMAWGVRLWGRQA